jgi:hypothetical protein
MKQVTWLIDSSFISFGNLCKQLKIYNLNFLIYEMIIISYKSEIVSILNE